MNPRWFPYKILPKYPHLRQYEIDIWECFIKGNPNLFDTVAYDVTMTAGKIHLQDPGDKQSENWDYLSSFKIDALGIKKDIQCIIELKTSAAAATLGQLLLYNKLYKKQHYSTGSVFLLVIAETFAPCIKDLLNDFGIQCVSVGFPNNRLNCSNFMLLHKFSRNAKILAATNARERTFIT